MRSQARLRCTVTQASLSFLGLSWDLLTVGRNQRNSKERRIWIRVLKHLKLLLLTQRSTDLFSQCHLDYRTPFLSLKSISHKFVSFLRWVFAFNCLDISSFHQHFINQQSYIYRCKAAQCSNF